MYLFRQFWRVFGLADFFQNLIVSRASVNGDREKGPPLPQSFSTEPGIESGLYIAPGTILSDLGQQKSELSDKVRVWSESPTFGPTCRKCSGQRFWPDPARSPFWQVLARLALRPRNHGNPRNPTKSWKSQKSHKSRLFRKSPDLYEIIDSKISQVSDPIAVQMCYMCLEYVQQLSRMSSDSMCTACLLHAWHIDTTYIVATYTRTLHQSSTNVAVLHYRALWK